MLPIRDTIPSRTVPFVTYAIVLANAAAFRHELGLGRGLEAFLYTYGLVPAVWTHPLLLRDLSLGEKLLPLLTSTFLHGGWFHVISNLWTLLIFGDNVEDRLGHFRYLLFYLLSGIGAGLIQLWANWGSPAPTIGASGAIAGVMGAYFLLYPWARIVTLVPVFFIPQLVEIPAFIYLGVWFASQVYSGALSPGAGFSGIAWWAHIGGFAAGLLLVRRLLPRRRKLYLGR